MMFSPGGIKPRTMRLLAFSDSKVCAKRKVFILKESFVRTGHSSFSFFPPANYTFMFTPQLFQTCTHSCRLTGSCRSEAPSFFWPSTLQSRDSCLHTVGLNEILGKGCQLTQFSMNEAPTLQWGERQCLNRSQPWLPAESVSQNFYQPPSLPHSTSYFSDHQTNRPLNTFSAGWGEGVFSQSLAPTGSRLCQESFLLLLFCFVFVFYEWLWEKMQTGAQHCYHS